MRRRGRGFIAVFALAAVAAGCGGDPKHYADARIVERLHLEETDGGYAIDGDPFCEVERKLLNDFDEVEAAADEDEIGLIVASSEANAGVSGVAPFAQDCRSTAKKRLNKLDPVPKED